MTNQKTHMIDRTEDVVSALWRDMVFGKSIHTISEVTQGTKWVGYTWSSLKWTLSQTVPLQTAMSQGGCFPLKCSCWGTRPCLQQ